MEASSLRMSPKVFSVTMTSKALGLRISCIAQLSTYRCDSSTSGYSFATSVTTSRQSWEVARMFALSTRAELLAPAARGLEADAGDAADLLRGVDQVSTARNSRRTPLLASPLTGGGAKASRPLGWP